VSGHHPPPLALVHALVYPEEMHELGLSVLLQKVFRVVLQQGRLELSQPASKWSRGPLQDDPVGH
jgi:hypothetical protein